MVPYVDMMTTLCIFFLLLYGLFMAFKTDVETTQGKLMASQVSASMDADPELKDAAKIEVKKDSVKLSLEASVMFGLGSAKLRPVAIPTFIKLAEVFRNLPPEYEVIVEGNTDNAAVFYGGDYTSNWELSLYRALSLIQLFTENGNSQDRFSAAGYSEYNQLYPNDTPEHQAANRRVEIVIKFRGKSALEEVGDKIPEIAPVKALQAAP
jgi:flagellar motor protein MotB